MLALFLWHHLERELFFLCSDEGRRLRVGLCGVGILSCDHSLINPLLVAKVCFS